jgi:Ca2+-binding RTX toxin-like protein
MCSFCSQAAFQSGNFAAGSIKSVAANSAFTISPNDNNNIDGLLSGYAWTSKNLTWRIATAKNDYDTNPLQVGIQYDDMTRIDNWLAPTTAMTSASNFIFNKLFAAVSGLTFTAVAANNFSADLTIGRSTATADFGTAYAYYPTGSGNGVSGDSWFSTSNEPDLSARLDAPKLGGYNWATYIHEFGHTIGLKHGHEVDGRIAMNTNRDSMEFSIMTYRSYIGAPLTGYTNESYGYAQTLMMYDIAALQVMYGANFNENSGNTTYTFSATTGEMFVNGVSQGAPGDNRIFRTLWDGNGVDTCDLSNYTTSLQIDLTPGGWSVFSAVQLANLGNGNIARGNLFNALQSNADVRSLIENATGGSGNDTITGNAANNNLNGGGGADTIDGGLGVDSIFGGFGNDTLTGGADNDAFIFTVAELAIGQIDTITDFAGGVSGGNDTLRLVGFAPSNVFVTAASGAVTVSYGNGIVSNTVILQAAALNQIYVQGYSTVANALSGNLSNGFIFLSDAANEGSNSWTRQIRSFDAVATLDWINTSNDNGSRLFQDFDNLSAQSWSNVVESYDSLNRIESRDTINDDSSRSKQYFDNLGTQACVSIIDAFSTINTGGLLLNEVTLFDSGVRTASYFDTLNTSDWRSIVNTFSNGNRLQTETINYDGGNRSVQFIDHLSNNIWSGILQNLDVLSRLMNETTNYDNGTREAKYIDYEANKAWTSIVDVLSEANVLQNETTNYDDGSRLVFYNDWQLASSNIWTSIADQFDNLNRLSTETIRYDTGNRIETDFDQNVTNSVNGEFAWSTDIYTYNTANVLIQHYQIMDNGTTVFF